MPLTVAAVGKACAFSGFDLKAAEDRIRSVIAPIAALKINARKHQIRL
jgi:hypothetical protein